MPRRRIATTKSCSADKEIAAVLIATPEHWHHRMVLDALAAGKDVYVEKPLCQTPEQGVELVEAEKRSKNIVQVGMQRRSYDLYIEGRKTVASGVLGAVRMVRSWWLNNYLGSSDVRSSRVRSTGSSGRVPLRTVRSIRTAFATGGSSPTMPAASSPTRARMSLTASTCS